MSLIWIVEDDPKIRANLLFQLRQEGFSTSAFENAESAYSQLESGRGRPDLMLLDVRLPGMSGLDLVRRLAAKERLPATIILSGEASISETVEALKLGVHDFIEKPFSKERLLQSMNNTLEHNALRREVAALRDARNGTSAILGQSPAVEEMRQRIARAAPTDARVLIRGESGTGKELVASALHHQSPRRDQPFIKINCAAIPSHLIEDELFGHVKGAFTDARAPKPGLFEEADGGTLFLDEIGDMEITLQARLLRVLEDGRVRRLGDTRDREVDVRVIAATHCDLEAWVREGRFREDLYFRLAHLPIEVPPLRARGEDIPLLFEHFFDSFVQRHRVRRQKIDPAVFEKLSRYPWPGNVRELKSLCERLVVFGSDPITCDQLPTSYFAGGPASETGLLRLDQGQSALTLRALKTQCEREYIEHLLRHTGWNISATARLLDIQRTYLHQKISVLGLRRPGSIQELEAGEAESRTLVAS